MKKRIKFDKNLDLERKIKTRTNYKTKNVDFRQN